MHMPRIVTVLLIYNRHKHIDSIKRLDSQQRRNVFPVRYGQTLLLCSPFLDSPLGSWSLLRCIHFGYSAFIWLTHRLALDSLLHCIHLGHSAFICLTHRLALDSLLHCIHFSYSAFQCLTHRLALASLLTKYVLISLHCFVLLAAWDWNGWSCNLTAGDTVMVVAWLWHQNWFLWRVCDRIWRRVLLFRYDSGLQQMPRMSEEELLCLAKQWTENLYFLVFKNNHRNEHIYDVEWSE
jgi:hypothetical protein